MKPTLALRKEDETAFINARTYWSLSVTTDESTLELRVRHRHPEDIITFWSCCAGERDQQLHSVKEFDAIVDAYLEHEVDTPRGARGDAVLEVIARGHRVMTRRDQTVYDDLLRHWDAFVLLFNPAVNM